MRGILSREWDFANDPPFVREVWFAEAWVDEDVPVDVWGIEITKIQPREPICCVDARPVVWPNIRFNVQPGDSLAIGHYRSLFGRLTVVEVESG